jgi:hypothetical protein
MWTSAAQGQGRAAGAWPRDPVTGTKLPRKSLTWRDIDDEIIEGQVTYDHKPFVVDHWNDVGRFQSRAERRAWFDNPDHLTPMALIPNSREGALHDADMKQETGPNYS